MEDCISKDAIEIIKRSFCWHKKGLLMWFMAVRINKVKTR